MDRYVTDLQFFLTSYSSSVLSNFSCVDALYCNEKWKPFFPPNLSKNRYHYRVLDASTQFYKSVCLSVRWSVGPSRVFFKSQKSRENGIESQEKIGIPDCYVNISQI